jgi:hypothetical protein
MKQYYLFFLIVLMACDPDPPITGSCELNLFDGFSFTGDVRVCNASGSQQTILASASMVVKDSLFIINIVDDDPHIDYFFTDTAVVNCVYWEGNENYELYEFKLTNPSKIGLLSTNGTTLHLDIRIDPCPESTAFDGLKN